MLISLFFALVCPFGTLVVPFAVLGFGWVVFSLAARGLGCELGTLISPFSALVLPFGTLDVPFCIFPLGWVSRSFGFSVLVVPFVVSGFG